MKSPFETSVSQTAAAGPCEHDPESLARYLLSFDWPMRDAPAMERLIGEGLSLWMQVLRLVPDRRERGRLLELGSPPFNITLLVQKLRNYEMTLTGEAADGRALYRQQVTSSRFGESYVFECVCFDLERQLFPFADEHFDAVMCCEVIEHLTENPVAVLSEIHRVLKPGGTLILSTPNVASAAHIMLLLGGGNIYDSYHLGALLRGSRHSREYVLAELVALIEGCGFRIDHAEGRDLIDTARVMLEMAGLGRKMPWLPYLALKAVKFGIRTAPWIWRAVASVGVGERASRERLIRSGHLHAEHLFVRAVKEGRFRWAFPPRVFDQGHLAWYLRVSDREVEMGQNDIPHTGPGWGPLDRGPDGKAARRAQCVVDGYLLSRERCRSVIIEVAGIDTAAPVEIQVWEGKAGEARWLTTGHLDAPPGRWVCLDIPLGPETRVGEQIQLRILAPTGVHVHRFALQP